MIARRHLLGTTLLSGVFDTSAPPFEQTGQLPTFVGVPYDNK